MPGDAKTLAQRAVKAAAWGYLGTAARLVIQLGSQIVLARLLGPAEYGLFAVAVIAVSLGVLASDIASSALIHVDELGEPQIRFAFTWQIASGLFLCGLLASISEPLAAWVRQPDLGPILLASAPVCLLNALGGVSLALLRRRLDYGTIQLWQTLGYFIGYVLVGIPLAALTPVGVWALVAAWAVQVTVTTLGYLWRAPHAWAPLLHCASGRSMIAFGLQAMLANFSNWALANVDRLIVARTASMRDTGLYSTVINLLSTPLAQILGTYQSVAFAASARSGEESARQTFLLMLSGGSLIVCLLFGIVLAIPDTLIAVMYGPKWADAEAYMTAFAIGFIAYGIQATITPLLWGKGAVEKEAIPQFFMAVTLGMTAWVAAQHSSLAVGWAFAGVNILRCVWILGNSSKAFGVSIIEILRILCHSAIPAGALSICIWLVDQVWESQVDGPLLCLSGDVFAGLLLAVFMYLTRHNWMHRDLVKIVDAIPLLVRSRKASA